MSEHHADRAPLLLKLALRDCMRRLGAEAEAASQLEALAGNLGWEEVARRLAGLREALHAASQEAAGAVEAAVSLQVEAAREHASMHEHEHQHIHTHPHQHPHDHEHG